MFYLDLFKALQEDQIRYAVVGGLAMNLHGVPRMTMDVDIVLLLEDDNLQRFIALAERLNLQSGVPVELAQLKDASARQRWILEKGMIAFPLRPPLSSDPTVDIIIDPLCNAESVINHAIPRGFGGLAVMVATIEDLIAMKARAGRTQDIADIEHLRRLGKESDTK